MAQYVQGNLIDKPEWSFFTPDSKPNKSQLPPDVSDRKGAQCTGARKNGLITPVKLSFDNPLPPHAPSKYKQPHI